MSDHTVTDVEVAGFGREARASRGALGYGLRNAGVMLGALVIIVSVVTIVEGASADLVNPGGWTLLRRFWAAALRPDLTPTFVWAAVRATVTTLGYAVAGTAAAMAIGLAGALALSETWWRRDVTDVGRAGSRLRDLRWGWFIHRGAWALPRGVHEAVWGLLFISVLGRDPLVAVLAIAIPFGAITAKVYAELIDEQPAAAYEALRAAGAGRLAALAYGVLPGASRDLISYGFYRFECSIRSSIVLGIIGAGGVGFQLALSFQSLRYEEMWTLIYLIVVLSGSVEVWSAALRRAFDGSRIRWSIAVGGLLLVGSVVYLGVDIRTLASGRTWELAGEFLERLWPPRLPAGGLQQLSRDAVETLRMSIVASVLATMLAIGAAFSAALCHTGFFRSIVGWTSRLLLLACRAIPPPVWALILLFVLFPGPLPGAVALGLYNFGILGRLLAEVVENHDQRPLKALRGLGSPPAMGFVYAVIPEVAPRFVAYSLYRWEVTMRETVIVGLVGAGGLGRLLAEQNAAFDHGGMLVTVGVLVVLTLVVDFLSSLTRSALR